jgi:hypothetical protein
VVATVGQQRAIDSLSRVTRFLADKGQVWESWYLATEVLSPLLEEREHSSLRSELTSKWPPISAATEWLASIPRRAREQPDAFTSGQLELQIAEYIPTAARIGNSRRLGRMLRRLAYDFFHAGDYRSAMRTALLAPLTAAAPDERRHVLTQLWNYAMPIAPGQVRLSAPISHLLIDRGYLAISADLVAGALEDSSDAQIREVWKDLDAGTIRPIVGSEPLPEKINVLLRRDVGSTDLAKVERELAASSREQPPTPAPAGPPADGKPPGGTSGPGPAFYFVLEGQHVYVTQVQVDTDFDLVFNYDVPPADAVAIVADKGLDDLRVKNLDLDIWVSPSGVKLRDDGGLQTMQFRDGRPKEPARFKLRAGPEPATARLKVDFIHQQRQIYSLLIELQVVREVTRSESRPEKLWDLAQRELDEIVKNYGPVDAVLQLWGEGPQIEASLLINGRATGRPAKAMSLTSLATYLKQPQADIEPVARHDVWLAAASPFTAVPPDAQDDVLDCLAHVASAGSSLYETLRDNGLKAILGDINGLRDGARLRIDTDYVFLPWEIMYPEVFSHERWDGSAAAIDVRQFWGHRFVIETRLVPKESGHSQTPPSPRQQGPLDVSLNINNAIDGAFSTVKPKPAASHVDYYKKAKSTVKCELQQTGADIKTRLLAADNTASLIYLFCHGQSDQPFQPGHPETLEFDPNTSITPDFLNDKRRFAGQPVVVINSCSSGAFTPLALSTFLSRFLDRGAVGLISTTFPVPATSAAVIGQKLLDEYVLDRPLGATLWDMRRSSLATGNPIALFYTTQCDMDTTAPAH